MIIVFPTAVALCTNNFYLQHRQLITPSTKMSWNDFENGSSESERTLQKSVLRHDNAPADIADDRVLRHDKAPADIADDRVLRHDNAPAHSADDRVLRHDNASAHTADDRVMRHDNAPAHTEDDRVLRHDNTPAHTANDRVLRHDNAPGHTALSIREFMARKNIPVIPHPPYSPDLAPCDFFLFPKLKSKLKVHQFGTMENIKKL